MKKKYGFVLIAAILLASCGQKKETKTTTSRPVKTAIVESRSIIRKDFSGIVEAVEYVKLAFRVNGQIIQLPVIEGQKVKKGEPLMKIDISYLKEHAPSLCSPVLCTELGDNQKVRLLKEGEIKAGEPLFAVDVYEA